MFNSNKKRFPAEYTEPSDPGVGAIDAMNRRNIDLAVKDAERVLHNKMMTYKSNKYKDILKCFESQSYSTGPTPLVLSFQDVLPETVIELRHQGFYVHIIPPKSEKDKIQCIVSLLDISDYPQLERYVLPGTYTH